MKVKMTETFQGRDVTALHTIDGINVSILEAGEEYQVSDGLGAWLVENYKAKLVQSPLKVETRVEPPPAESEIVEPVKFDKKRGRK